MRLKWQALTIGVVVAAAQLAAALTLAPGRGIVERYDRLCAWDCAWYESIARQGYRSPVPPKSQDKANSNVAFFPAYPYVARVIHLSTGLPASRALLVVAQVFSVTFWAALWLWLRRWRVPSEAAILVLLAVLAHPAAFFLISGYSESLFLSSLVGFIVYSRRASRGISAGLGVVMTATRVIGVVAALLPLWNWAFGKLTASAFWRSLFLSIGAMMGALAFVIFCAIAFGEFDLYFDTQRAGWGISPDYGAILKWFSLRFRWPMDSWATRISGGAFLLVAALEFALGDAAGRKRRVPVYLIACSMFWFTLSGLKNVGFQSMIRYTLPWHVLLLVGAAQIVSRRCKKKWVQALLIVIACALILWSTAAQLTHLADFLHGGWFA